MSEPKGFCPFCKTPGWEICNHFVGYARGEKIYQPSESTRGKHHFKPLGPKDVKVETGVSVRVYNPKRTEQVSKPEQKPMLNPPKHTRSPMPADLQAANRIDQVLNALSLEDAELVLDRANRMLTKRKALADKPPHLPE